MYNLAFFLLTYKRADLQHTIKTLTSQGYSNLPIHFIVSDDDPTIDKLKENYPQYQIHIFNKKEIETRLNLVKLVDTYASILYARNYTYILAKELGLDYFVIIEDDYTSIYNIFTRFYYKGAKKSIVAPSLLESIYSYIEILKSNKDFMIVAGAQGGDFILSPELAKTKRKAMNFLICKTDRVVKFISTINDDVTTYALYGLRGYILLTIPTIIINQYATQSQSGGVTEAYLNNGTYKKSFSAHIVAPSVVSLDIMGRKNYRIHHRINYKRIPQIISSKYKKC